MNIPKRASLHHASRLATASCDSLCNNFFPVFASPVSTVPSRLTCAETGAMTNDTNPKRRKKRLFGFKRAFDFEDDRGRNFVRRLRRHCDGHAISSLRHRKFFPPGEKRRGFHFVLQSTQVEFSVRRPF